jgi:glycosyltransferase involved in cell wall biosynthesis
MDTLTLVCPVARKDFNRFLLLNETIQKNLKGAYEFILITPEKTKDNLGQVIMESLRDVQVQPLKYRVVTDEKLLGNLAGKIEEGWTRQQLIKLMVSVEVKTDFYLLLDSDVICSREIVESDLLERAHQGHQPHQAHHHGVRAKIQFDSSEGQMTAFAKTKEFLKSDRTAPTMMSVTPAIFSTELALRLLDEVTPEGCLQALRLGATEYSLYFHQSLAKSSTEESQRRGGVATASATPVNGEEKVTQTQAPETQAPETQELQKSISNIVVGDIPHGTDLEKFHVTGKLTSDNSVWFQSHAYEWDPKAVNAPFTVYQSNTGIPIEFIRDQLNPPTQGPLVSCLMVTRDRLHHVKRAIRSYQAQTYPNKELVIVVDSKDGVKDYVESLGDPSIHVVEVKGKYKLGGLRNISVENAKGVYLAQWDDDDHYHPSRLSLQIQMLEKTQTQACLLGKWMLAWPAKDRYAVSKFRSEGWEGSMVIRKSKMIKYMALPRLEDLELIKQLNQAKSKMHIIQNDGFELLYVYHIHGKNTWDEKHFGEVFEKSTPLSEMHAKGYPQIFAPPATPVTNPSGEKTTGGNAFFVALGIVFLIIIIIIIIVVVYRFFFSGAKTAPGTAPNPIAAVGEILGFSPPPKVSYAEIYGM